MEAEGLLALDFGLSLLNWNEQALATRSGVSGLQKATCRTRGMGSLFARAEPKTAITKMKMKFAL